MSPLQILLFVFGSVGNKLLSETPAARVVNDQHHHLHIECPSWLIESCAPAIGHMVASPYDCRRYYVCSVGQQIILRTCPRGLHFNEEKSVCDYPQNTVNCTFGLKTEYKANNGVVIPVYPPYKCNFAINEEE